LSWVKTAGELQNRIHSIRAKTLEEKWNPKYSEHLEEGNQT
jgi:hypothetical protein